MGVQRAGTTWWYELIQEHPDVVRRYPKELHFFNRRATHPDGMTLRKAYWAYFPRPAGRLVGEWTPDYIHRDSVPKLLAAAAPGSKFLVMLRDPVERYRSGIALQKDLWSGRISERIQKRAFVRGFYAEHLELFFATIPPDRALILQYERCRQDPAGELSRTYDFLGLDKSFLPNRLDRVRNPSVQRKPELQPGLHSRLLEAYEPDVRRLANMLDGFDLRLWQNFRHLAA
ncbi:MAG: sulfotransferase family protein [Actinomycetota bacterium]